MTMAKLLKLLFNIMATLGLINAGMIATKSIQLAENTMFDEVFGSTIVWMALCLTGMRFWKGNEDDNNTAVEQN